MTHATDIVAYIYQADICCPSCIEDMFVEEYERTGRDAFLMSTENLLRAVAQLRGIDYDNQYSYDSDDFPKPVFASELESDEHCGSCQELIDD